MDLSVDAVFRPLTNHIAQFVPKIPVAVVTFAVAYVGLRIVLALVTLSLKTVRMNAALKGILTSTVAILLWVGVVALTLESLGLGQIAVALSGSVALIAVGIGTGMNKLVSDVIAGIFLAREHHFGIGKEVTIAGISGRVQSIDSRKVRIIDSDGNINIIPNNQFDTQPWTISAQKEAEHGK